MNAKEAFEKSTGKLNSIGSRVDIIVSDIIEYIDDMDFTQEHQFVKKFVSEEFGVTEVQQKLTQQGLEELGYIVTYVPISTLDECAFWGYLVSWEKKVEVV